MNIKELQEFWKGFPESPFSDTFKWIDAEGYEHMLTIRGWSGDAVLESVAKAKERIAELGGIAPANRVAAPAPSPSAQIQETDPTGLPVVDAEGQPRMVDLPKGVAIYTVKEVFRDQNKDKTKDLLKVTTVEEAPFISRKYGVTCFHPPAQYKDFKDWPIGTKYAPRAGAMRVIIREPEAEGKYANILEFRA